MRITLLNRGGLSVYGLGHYDAHTDEAVIAAGENETRAVTIDWGAAATVVSKQESGITATSPSTTGAKTTLTLSSIQDGGYVDVLATVSGEARKVRIRGRSSDSQDGYGC